MSKANSRKNKNGLVLEPLQGGMVLEPFPGGLVTEPLPGGLEVEKVLDIYEFDELIDDYKGSQQGGTVQVRNAARRALKDAYRAALRAAGLNDQ